MPPGASLKGITPGEEDDDYSDGSKHYAACPYHIRIRERLAVTVLPRQMPLCVGAELAQAALAVRIFASAE
jgi:hypothetical protein